MTHQPHDILAKNFLTNVEVAADFLRAHLDPDIVPRCNFSTLRIEPASFIETDLRLHISDIMYSLEIDNKPGIIYGLVEAERNAKKFMVLRFVRYGSSALKHFVEKYKPEKLPVIIPILIYTGKTTYPYSTDFFDSFAEPELARTHFFNPKLIDLSVIEDDEIKQHGKAAFYELVSKHIFDRDIMNLAYDLATLLKTLTLPRDLFQHLINYVYTEGDSENYKEFLEVIIQNTKDDLKEDAMTIAERLKLEGENIGYERGIHAGVELGKQEGIQLGKQEGIQLGKQEGIQQGMQKGKLEGEHEKALEIAKNLLSLGLEISSIEKATGLSAQQILALKKVH